MAISAPAPYKTRPIEAWGKMKELRRNIMRDLWATKKRGDVLYQGGYAALVSLPAGLGNVGAFGWGPQMGAIMRDPALARRCNEAAENDGLGPDCCVTLRVNYGSALIGMHNQARSGEKLQPDFAWDVHQCEAQAKTAQYFAEFYKVPLFAIDMPILPQTHDMEAGLKYLVAQMHEFIEWMEKITKREYKDELLVEAAKREWATSIEWSKLCDLQKSIPAPLDYRLLNSLAALLVTSKHREGVPELMAEIVAETRDRIRDKVAAMPYERCRLLHEGQPPYYYPPLLKIPRDFGATFIGGRMLFVLHGAWELQENFSLKVARPPRELGLEIKDRDTALRALAELYLVYGRMMVQNLQFYKGEETIQVARDWHADGVVFHLDRGCKGGAAGNIKNRFELQRAGIPSMCYEGSNADPRDLAETQVVDRIEAFLESLGLTKITRETEGLADEKED